MVGTRIAGFHRGQEKRRTLYNNGQIGPIKRDEMRSPFHRRVGEIHQTEEQQQAKDPTAARVIKSAMARVPAQFARQDYRAYEIEDDRKAQDENVKFERPMLFMRELVLPTPQEQRLEKHQRYHEQVHSIKLPLINALDEAGHTFQQMRDGKAGNHRRQDHLRN